MQLCSAGLSDNFRWVEVCGTKFLALYVPGLRICLLGDDSCKNVTFDWVQMLKRTCCLGARLISDLEDGEILCRGTNSFDHSTMWLEEKMLPSTHVGEFSTL